MPHDLRLRYLDYLAVLNERRFDDLGGFVAERLTYNGEPIDLARYRRDRQDEIETFPDLRFEIGLLVVEGECLAARLEFDCTPARPFLGRAPSGNRIEFAEHAFYRFEHGLIVEVRSLLDVEAVRRQLAPLEGSD